jgi:hypothetical protein
MAECNYTALIMELYRIVTVVVLEVVLWITLGDCM